jgi:hypothetical protein
MNEQEFRLAISNLIRAFQAAGIGVPQDFEEIQIRQVREKSSRDWDEQIAFEHFQKLEANTKLG